MVTPEVPYSAAKILSVYGKIYILVDYNIYYGIRSNS